ncbi:hypothetical protein [Paenibacillus sp. HB172176]|uniref:hypothetical protein n=1 Tax=Paenibacillus sp. HB172176 TaxID=2493690 RepID=UPI001439F817|nr:hypothetical protein [Paenibacillus sp. HB172176]
MKVTKKHLLRLFLIGLTALFILSFFSANLTVRRYLFLRLHFVSAIRVDINQTNHHDEEYGQLYDVKGYEDIQTRDEINVFYLKRHWTFWSVRSAGTGP